MGKSGGDAAIKVFLRCRPQDDDAPNDFLSISLADSTLEVSIPEDHDVAPLVGADNERFRESTFKFHGILDEDATQDDVFELLAHDCVQSIAEGVNGTIFAYGQSGSGKTFSISGSPESFVADVDGQGGGGGGDGVDSHVGKNRLGAALEANLALQSLLVEQLARLDVAEAEAQSEYERVSSIDRFQSTRSHQRLASTGPGTGHPNQSVSAAAGDVRADGAAEVYQYPLRTSVFRSHRTELVLRLFCGATRDRSGKYGAFWGVRARQGLVRAPNLTPTRFSRMHVWTCLLYTSPSPRDRG